MAQFLAQLGSPLSGGASIEFSKGEEADWRIKELETVFMEPTKEYVERSIERPDMQAMLRKNRVGGGAVYIITGLKIARGASYSTSTSRKVQVSTEVVLDAAALVGIPVSTGPELGVGSEKMEKESCAMCSDFAWAVRMRKIRLISGRRRLWWRMCLGASLIAMEMRLGRLGLWAWRTVMRRRMMRNGILRMLSWRIGILGLRIHRGVQEGGRGRRGWGGVCGVLVVVSTND